MRGGRGSRHAAVGSVARGVRRAAERMAPACRAAYAMDHGCSMRDAAWSAHIAPGRGMRGAQGRRDWWTAPRTGAAHRGDMIRLLRVGAGRRRWRRRHSARCLGVGTRRRGWRRRWWRYPARCLGVHGRGTRGWSGSWHGRSHRKGHTWPLPLFLGPICERGTGLHQGIAVHAASHMHFIDRTAAGCGIPVCIHHRYAFTATVAHIAYHSVRRCAACGMPRHGPLRQHHRPENKCVRAGSSELSRADIIGNNAVDRMHYHEERIRRSDSKGGHHYQGQGDHQCAHDG